jgi:cyclopropane-fatty-acyl-phospholipid synthase
VTGLTLSRAQAELARERVRAAGLDRLVEIRVDDYRAVAGRYSRIASIEMLEAVGLREYPTFFRACDRLLAPEGVAVLQTIGVPDRRFERYRRTPDWIQRYVFPGSLLPSLEALTRAIAGTRLMVVGLEEIGIFYARTLREWRERFLARLDDVRALGYDRRFERIWTFYLASCEAAFATRTLRDMQLVLTRPGNGSLPDLPAPRIGF